MIEDPELRSLFQSEGEERLNHLQQGLQQLESNPDQKAVIEDIFRDAHTLKGSARMLGIPSIEQLAHALEDVLGAVKKGELTLTASIISIFYETLDAIRLLVNEAVTGVSVTVPVSTLLQKLKIDSLKQEKVKPSVESGRKIEKITQQIYSQPVLASSIRVPIILVNELVTRAGDLTIAKSQQQRLLEDIESLQGYWDSKSEIRNLKSHDELFRRMGEKVSKLYEEGYESVHKLDQVVTPMIELIRKLGLVPLSKLFDFFPSMVRELSQACSKEVELVVQGGENSVDKSVLEEMKDPLMHLIRNAIDHGIETPSEREALGKPRKGTIILSAQQTANQIVIEIADDGRGLDVEAIKQTALNKGLKAEQELEIMSDAEIHSLIFLPGFSTKKVITDISGRGVGMDVVYTNIKKLRGNLQVNTTTGKGCRFIIHLPITLLTTKVLLVKSGKSHYAIPIESIERCDWVSKDQLNVVSGQRIMFAQGHPIPVGFLWDILEEEIVLLNDSYQYPCIILNVGGRPCGVLVESIIVEEEVLIEPPSPYLLGIDHISGSTLLRSGEVVVVINSNYLAEAVQGGSFFKSQEEGDKEKHKIRVLIVDDSPSMRVILRRLLENKGYEVLEASDGLQAWMLLQVEKEVTAVVSDIEMPHMNGWALLEKIKSEKRFHNLPVILMTSLSSPEHRKRGLDLGATAFLVKSEQSYSELIQLLRRKR